jgi:hypothetical protein
MAPGDGADRLERGGALLAWLEGEGCAHALRLGETPDAGGVGVFAARDVKRGETLVVMPAACAMRAADTRASPDDDDATADFKAALDHLRGADGAPIDDSARVQLLLLRERAAAWTDGIRSGGRWAHYVRALPGDELTRALPLSWSDEDLRRRLAGTAMHADVLADRAALEHLSRALADANVRVPHEPTPTPTPRTPPFPEDAFGPDRLRWAHAVFWSRAIALPLPSWSRGAGAGAGSDGALTPLLDLCNHAAGSRVSLRARGARVELVAERDVAEGEEVRINYGAKGNAELLRRHGFVLPDNPADVCPLTLDELSVETTETETAPATETPKARAEGSETFYLFRGMEAFGMLPEGLIRAAVAKRRGVRVEDVRDAVECGGEETRGEEAAAARAVARLARATAARVPAGTPPPIAAAVDPGGFESAPGWRADRAGWEYRRAQRELLEELERAARAAAEAAERCARDGNGVR